MTHRFTAASAAGADPSSPPSGYDAPPRTHGWRRFGALSLAAGTFLGLGALVGPVGMANAEPPGCGVNGADVATALANADNTASGSNITLCGDVDLPPGATLGAGKKLVIDLASHTLTIKGADGGGATATSPGELGVVGLTNSGTLIITNGSLVIQGGNGGNGSEGAPGSEGVETPFDGNAGGTAGIGINNIDTLYITAAASILGGSGGTGGNGGEDGGGGAYSGGNGGAGGDGAVGLQNTAGGKILARSLESTTGSSGASGDPGAGEAGGDAGNGGAGGIGWAPAETDPTLILNAGEGAASPAMLNAYGTWGSKATGITDAVAANLAGYWPNRDGYTVGAWLNADNSAMGTAAPEGQTVYAEWTAAAGPSPNPQPNPNANPPAVPTTSATATTSKAAPSTTASPTKPATTTSTRPSSTAPSIPTNNVKNPETFVSSQAPAPQPLPGISEVDDTSASQFDVNTHTPTQGGDLTLTAKGFKPGTVVDFWMHSTPVYLGSAIADIHGVAVLPIKLTPALVGNHHVQSIGTGLKGEPRNLAQPITIAAAPTAPALASTGVATAPLAFLAVLLLAAGAAILLADRRRSDQAAAGGHR